MPSFGDELGRLIPHMRRFARALVRGHSSQVADDLVQETIVLATRAERIARGPHLRSWCFASLIRVHRHWEQTSSAPGGEYLPGARTVSPAYATAADGTLAFMPKEIARLDQLPLDEREVLLLTVLVGMSYAQVAETLHLTVETVLARLDLARTMLARGQKFTGFSVQGGGAGSLKPARGARYLHVVK